MEENSIGPFFIEEERLSGAGELAQWLRVEDLNLVPSTYVRLLIATCNSSSRESDGPFVALTGTYTQCTHSCATSSIIKNKSLKDFFLTFFTQRILIMFLSSPNSSVFSQSLYPPNSLCSPSFFSCITGQYSNSTLDILCMVSKEKLVTTTKDMEV